MKSALKNILSKQSRYYALLVFMLGTFGSVYLYMSALDKEKIDTLTRFQQRAEIHAKDIEAEFQRSFFQVSSVANLFASAKWVSYAEFEEFVLRVFPQFPEGRRVTTLRRISADDAPQMISDLRQNPEPEYKNFDIFNFTAPNLEYAATPNDGYYSVITYTYPEFNQASFIGRNITPESPIWPLIKPVLEEKSPLISNLSNPIAGIRNEPFILYVFPILTNTPANSGEPSVQGLVISSQYISSLFGSIVSANRSDNFDYMLKDKNNNLYQFPKLQLIDHAEIEHTEIKFSFPINLINNQFELIISPKNQNLAPPNSLLLMLFLAGMALTLTLTFITQSLLSKQRFLNKQVKRKTSELVKQQQRLENKNIELSKALEDAKVSENAKAEFLANMSHEIRTPLNGVLGLTGLLKQTELNNTQMEYLDKLTFSGKHLLTVINDILDFSKIESGHVNLENNAFSINSVIDNLNVAFVETAKSKGIKFSISTEGLIIPDLMGDVFRINQVLINLCGNAMKFTQHGEVNVCIAMQMQTGNQLCVTFKVSDTGVGIDSKDIPNLFTKFSQADNSTTRKFGGTGLGLVISQKLCQTMGGDIQVESMQNQGSCFTASMYLQLNKEVLINTSEQHFIAGNIGILVVDDNPIALQILTDFLTNMGAKPIAVHSAQEGLAVLQDKKIEINVIITDWTMPIMDGASFIREANRLELLDPPKVIILSAYESSIIENGVGNLPIERVLRKPCPAAELYQAIEECLGRFKVQELDAKAELRLKNLNVLVVEDNEINQIIVQSLLTEEGAIITLANHGKEAIDVLEKNHNFDMILMDIHMPEMDGLAATKIIRAHGNPHIAKLPIIALSANVLEKDVQSYLAAGMNAHSAKPVDSEVLIKLILPFVK